MPSMVELVSRQRDRFRQRTLELEQDRDTWKQCADQERKRAEALHADNVKLVEKLRYCVALNRYSAATPRSDFFCLAGLLRPLLQGFSGILDFGGV